MKIILSFICLVIMTCFSTAMANETSEEKLLRYEYHGCITKCDMKIKKAAARCSGKGQSCIDKAFEDWNTCKEACGPKPPDPSFKD